MNIFPTCTCQDGCRGHYVRAGTISGYPTMTEVYKTVEGWSGIDGNNRHFWLAYYDETNTLRDL